MTNTFCTYNDFYNELKNTLNGYYIDYSIEEDTDDIICLSLKIDCDGIIAINKNTCEVVISFEDGNFISSSFFLKKDFDKFLFILSDVFKHKIKSCNYKGMH